MLPTRQPFVPDDFLVPSSLETPEFRLRMLTVHDLIKDFDAVMSSVEHLKFVWPHADWPESLTLEQNLVDLGWHQKEFQNRSSFAYAVMDLADKRELGCVYVNPSKKRGYDAVIYLWARQSVLASGLEERLLTTVRVWLASHWPFRNAALPGRDITWDDWNALPAA